MIPPWKGKNPIYFGVITIIPFDNLYRWAYFVMHTFLVRFAISLFLVFSSSNTTLSDLGFLPSSFFPAWNCFLPIRD
jgi:hypothetical protein